MRKHSIAVALKGRTFRACPELAGGMRHCKPLIFVIPRGCSFSNLRFSHLSLRQLLPTLQMCDWRASQLALHGLIRATNVNAKTRERPLESTSGAMKKAASRIALAAMESSHLSHYLAGGVLPGSSLSRSSGLLAGWSDLAPGMGLSSFELIRGSVISSAVKP